MVQKSWHRTFAANLLRILILEYDQLNECQVKSNASECSQIQEMIITHQLLFMRIYRVLEQFPGGNLLISCDGNNPMGEKNQNPQNSLGQTLIAKNSHAEFPSLVNCFYETDAR